MNKSFYLCSGMEGLPTTTKLYTALQHAFGLRHAEAAHFDANKAIVELLDGQQPMLWHCSKGGEPHPLLVDDLDRLKLLVEVALFQVKHNQENLIPSGQSYDSFRRACRDEIKKVAPEHAFNSGRIEFANIRYYQITGVLSPKMTGLDPGDEHIEYIAEKLNISVEEARRLDRAARADIAKLLGHKQVRSTRYYL
ncbi:hypothetical protein [Vibrio alfacsensis]|uniref:hypothetical protein n=1 Tax=Vibrio alfacsensis TaxID=1074311 RepID=UPI00406857EE